MTNPMLGPIPQYRAEALQRAAADVVDDLRRLQLATKRVEALRAALANLRVERVDQYRRMIDLLVPHVGHRIGAWTMSIEGGGASCEFVAWHHEPVAMGYRWCAQNGSIVGAIGSIDSPYAERIVEVHNAAIDALAPTPASILATPFWQCDNGIPLQCDDWGSPEADFLALEPVADDADMVTAYFEAMYRFLTTL